MLMYENPTCPTGFFVWHNVFKNSYDDNAISFVKFVKSLQRYLEQTQIESYVKDWSNSIANALELLQSCPKPSKISLDAYSYSPVSCMDIACHTSISKAQCMATVNVLRFHSQAESDDGLTSTEAWHAIGVLYTRIPGMAVADQILGTNPTNIYKVVISFKVPTKFV